MYGRGFKQRKAFLLLRGRRPESLQEGLHYFLRQNVCWFLTTVLSFAKLLYFFPNWAVNVLNNFPCAESSVFEKWRFLKDIYQIEAKLRLINRSMRVIWWICILATSGGEWQTSTIGNKFSRYQGVYWQKTNNKKKRNLLKWNFYHIFFVRFSLWPRLSGSSAVPSTLSFMESWIIHSVQSTRRCFLSSLSAFPRELLLTLQVPSKCLLLLVVPSKIEYHKWILAALAGMLCRILHYFFSPCVSGRNSTNPAIWLVPGAGGIFPSDPLSAGGIIKNVLSLSGNLWNDLCFYVNNNLSVKPLSLTWISSVFITICSLEIVQFVANLALITALKCSSLSHAFRCVVEKKWKCYSTA